MFFFFLNPCYIFFFPLCEQKEADNVKSDGKTSGDDCMEVENGEKEVASDSKA